MSNNSNENNIVTVEMDEDWEEWDGRSPFWAHCVAGSFAGVMEHAAIYPLDTVRTHIQVCASCLQQQQQQRNPAAHHNKFSEGLVRSAGHHASKTSGHHHLHPNQPRLPLGMWQTIRYLVSEPATLTAATANADVALTSAARTANNSNSISTFQNLAGLTRLFRGVQTVLMGCIPAHALYFSSYEIVKNAFLDQKTGQVTTLGSSLAGAAAVTAHDLIMTPLDTLKQRLQIGHYQGSVRQAFQAVYANEGLVALYRSFPVTLLTNVPYGMVMVSTHETAKVILQENSDRPQWQTVLMASSLGGFTASAVTTPLDRVKTCLQTQQLVPICARGKDYCPKKAARAAAAAGMKPMNWQQAFLNIWKKEGPAGFVRGLTPRVLSHTPAVAISWTTYETAKHYLLSNYH